MTGADDLAAFRREAARYVAAAHGAAPCAECLHCVLVEVFNAWAAYTRAAHGELLDPAAVGLHLRDVVADALSGMPAAVRAEIVREVVVSLPRAVEDEARRRAAREYRQ